MPYCEGCHCDVQSDQLFESTSSSELFCGSCIGKPYSSLPQTILGREFDYDFSYSRKDGIKATARLGKATLSFHLPQEELIKVLG